MHSSVDSFPFFVILLRLPLLPLLYQAVLGCLHPSFTLVPAFEQAAPRLFCSGVMWASPDTGAGMKGWENGRSPRKSADQRHRPARFPLAKTRWPGMVLNPVRLGGRRTASEKLEEIANGLYHGEPAAATERVRAAVTFILRRHEARPSVLEKCGDEVDHHIPIKCPLALMQPGGERRREGPHGTPTPSHATNRKCLDEHNGKMIPSQAEIVSHQDAPGSIPGEVSSRIFACGVVPDDAAGRRVFSGIYRFPLPRIPALIGTHLASPFSALKTSILRAAQISSLTHPSRKPISAPVGTILVVTSDVVAVPLHGYDNLGAPRCCSRRASISRRREQGTSSGRTRGQAGPITGKWLVEGEE
ncbi:hypothetical protein PR048_015389 [Dryococelus australis]|uniref:Uncharacterized protein n=1 Tax=Dryococelus australis TaxID=614101 RepID=A0ABQ9HGT5_9NEOP|nr:hypothetical protein PR048_015389 [Dryococelus australis]